MNPRIAITLALAVTLGAGCEQQPDNPPRDPSPRTDATQTDFARSNLWQIIEVKTGDSVIAQQGDRVYEIRLACLKAIPGEESRKVLKTNLDNGNISVYQIGISQLQKNAPDRISAEVFVDLGDGPQSLNEAQLMGGMAIIHEKASQANCPRLETMKQAQAEARESKSGAWDN